MFENKMLKYYKMLSKIFFAKLSTFENFQNVLLKIIKTNKL